MTTPLHRLLADAEADAHAEEQPAPLPEAVVSELRQIHAAYEAGCRFRPGDLVTPSSGRNVRGAGEPHIVLEVFPEPIRILAAPLSPGDAGSSVFGSRFDMRIACYQHGNWMAFMAESWMYEPYEDPDHG